MPLNRRFIRQSLPKENPMKFETVVLNGLFIACIAVCALVMGAMLRPVASTQLAGKGSAVSVLLDAPVSCALPADGVICPRANG
jgi:hypothetical protein